MATETIGPYQLHLIAEQISATGQWEPYVSIYKFDEAVQDFRCMLDKRRASEQPFAEYDAAIEQARRLGNTLVQSERW